MSIKSQITEKLLLLVLDGCRYDTAVEQMGILNHHVDYKQAQLIKVHAEMPSSSRPLYEVLATGVPSYRNGILTNADGQHSKELSIFDLVKAAGGSTAAAAHYWQSELFNQAPYEIKRDRIQHDHKKVSNMESFIVKTSIPIHMCLQMDIIYCTRISRICY
ncbi:hypothetical protein OM428_01310 [Enterococcus gallinarum]|nr:hypothetical protein [Enterococcus gallinarum]MCW3744024.1 hypothetical protein [Enterococcus gallinarum]